MGVKPADPKKCTKCGEHKPRSEFYRIAHLPNAVHSKCKACDNDYVIDRVKNKKHVLKEINRRSKLKRAFGISLEQFDEMLERQGGGCAICGSTSPGGKGSFCVDHCHSTGKIRGLLCNNCNIGIGNLKDDPSILRRAISYLLSEGCHHG